MTKMMKPKKPWINDEGWLQGVVLVTLDEVIDRDLKQFLDMLSSLMNCGELLMDIQWKVVGFGKPDHIYLEVVGDPGKALGHNEELVAMWNRWQNRRERLRREKNRRRRKKK